MTTPVIMGSNWRSHFLPTKRCALLEDGSVVSWGAHTHGGDSEDIQDQLKNIQFIAATSMAFCAVTNDGKVVTWGRGDEGGDSSAIQSQLSSLI